MISSWILLRNGHYICLQQAVMFQRRSFIDACKFWCRLVAVKLNIYSFLLAHGL